jgi:hypothetical protein
MDPISIALGLAQFAPSIIKYFTGSEKAANVAQQVVGIAQTVTGAQTPEQALEMMKANTAMAAEFQQKVLAADTDLQKAFLLDVQSARAMQIAALGQDDLFSKRFVYYFAAGWSLFAMTYFAAVTFYPLPAAGQRVADTILGVLITTVLGSITAYFFGSTKSSMDKTKLLAQSHPAK